MNATRAIGRHLPNLISLGRLVLAPIVVWLIIIDQLALAFWLLVFGGVSDAIDGLLARVLDARSKLGRYLDPTADKAILVGAFIALGTRDILPEWLVILVVSRDLFIIGGVLLLHIARAGFRFVSPSAISKANTALQILLVGSALAINGYGLDLAWLITAMIWAVAATTLASALGYLIRIGRELSSLEDTA